MTVSLAITGAIALATIDNPPVNATSFEVRKALLKILQDTEANPAVKAVVLNCAGRSFVAGADIREFGKPIAAPSLPDLLSAIEAAETPWTAAIHGSALGGGLELAMACRYRIARPDAQLGLPEVQLGLIPGAGGTARLPRLIPCDEALRMIATGKPIAAPKALELGLVDQLAEDDLAQVARAFTTARLSGGDQGLRTSEREVQPPKSEGGFEAQAKAIRAKAKGTHAPLEAIEALRDAQHHPFDAALTRERLRFDHLQKDPQSGALQYLFFAERASARVDKTKEIAASTLQNIAVVGGGTMGVGIAASALLAGFHVTLLERDADLAAQSHLRVTALLSNALERGTISQAQHRQICAEFQAAHRYEAIAQADLVIEAVFEDMQLKKEVFAQLEKTVTHQAILASNTSYLDINEIAQTLQHPGRVIGLHFFSPAHIMKLLEIVDGAQTSPETLAAALKFSKTLKKIPVVAGVCDGFIGNRIMSAYRREAEYMLEDGALPWQIDQAMRDFGFPMGLFEMQDLAGLDISWAMRNRQAATRAADERYVDIGDKLCEQGRFGRKAGQGYYIYAKGRPAEPDPEVEALILAESKRKGIERRAFTDAEIMQRILHSMQRVGDALIDQSIAQRAADIDVVMVNAYGFPRWRGGPMFMKDNGHSE